MARKATTNDDSKLKMNQIMLLKRKAKTSQNALTLKVGTFRFELPLEASVLASGDALFCQVKGGSAIYKMDSGSRKLMPLGQKDSAAAYKSLLRVGKEKKEKAKRGVELDEQTQALMRQLEAKLKAQGLKAAVDLKTGKLRAAKPRKRA